jgi:hypothetical protein
MHESIIPWQKIKIACITKFIGILTIYGTLFLYLILGLLGVSKLLHRLAATMGYLQPICFI